MAKTTLLSLGGALTALSLFSPAQAQTPATALSPASAVRPVGELSSTVPPPLPVVLPPSVPRQLRYVKLRNAPARQVALQLGWLNSGPSFSGATPADVTVMAAAAAGPAAVRPTPPSTPPADTATTTSSTATPPATNSAGQRARLSPEVLRFVPVEAQNAITFIASDEEASRLTEKIRALDVPQPKIGVEVRIYEPKTTDDTAALFGSSQPGTAQAFLQPIEAAVLAEHGRLVASQTIETATGATVDLSTQKGLRSSDWNWQLQTSSEPDGRLTLRVSRDGQIQTVQNLAPVSSGQLLALSTDRALQTPNATRRLVVFVPTIQAPRSSAK